ncbi:hypothetical protein AYO21_09407 [Fonsecaea monophora]|uniref:Uncharacterized protein n=1 Tax=Fonsecaea monophora TaxID=254056 RepID=A0A177EZF4_9EURO|nr:hypothetical protein AYO21_09407 [Fonsecaea monophora]OAG36422.1 hypothetical protein AYO21_09407 [Fonsecaea monophora]
MVTFTKLAATSVLIICFAGAAPVKNPSSIGERIKCLTVGCPQPEELHPYIGSVTQVDRRDVVPLRNAKVEDITETGGSEVVMPAVSTKLVKNSIVKKPLEALVGEETNDPEHGKRDIQKQLEQDGVEEGHEGTSLTNNSPLYPTRTLENPESAQAGTGARNPLLRAEDGLVNVLERTVMGRGSDLGRNN